MKYYKIVRLQDNRFFSLIDEHLLGRYVIEYKLNKFVRGQYPLFVFGWPYDFIEDYIGSTTEAAFLCRVKNPRPINRVLNLNYFLDEAENFWRGHEVKREFIDRVVEGTYICDSVKLIKRTMV